MGNENARTGQQAHEFQTTITKTIGCKYLLFLPGQYGSQANRWSLILFLHGAGERGDDLELVRQDDHSIGLQLHCSASIPNDENRNSLLLVYNVPSRERSESGQCSRA